MALLLRVREGRIVGAGLKPATTTRRAVFDLSTCYVLLMFLANARVERLKGTTGKFARSFLHIGLAAENHLYPTPVQISN